MGVKQEKSARKILQKQVIIRKVLLAMLPCIAGSIYFFGWRTLAIIIWAGIVGFITEYIFASKRNKPVTEAVFVTTTIFALILPPTVGFHVVTIGTIFAVMFSKEVFGGFGKNIFNPAMAGRCFVYICFPLAMTATWAPAAEGFWGALGKWSTIDTPDTITSATPMAQLKAGKLIIANDKGLSNITLDPENKVILPKRLFSQLFFGRISGTMGVTSALLILIGGIYLFVTKTASRTIIISVITTYAVLNQLLNNFGVPPVPQAWNAVLGGGFLFGAFFMATDPVSAPRTELAKIFYGIIIGTCTLIIRNFSIFNGGLMFSILIGNMFAPMLDNIVRHFQNKKKPEVAA